MTIHAVLWDYGGVLVRMVDETPRQQLARRLGVSLFTLNRLVFESESARRGSSGEITITQHWQGIARLLKISDAELPAVINQFWAADDLDHALVDWIRSLRPAYRIGLLSNAWDNMRSLITDTWRIADLFDDMVISAEVRLRKPDLRIYALAAERLGFPPEEIVFFDDVPENVTGARCAGLQAFRYTGLADAQAALNSLAGN